MLTITEVSLLLHVHSNTVRRWANQGKIKTYRVASRGDRRFEREDVISFMAKMNEIADNEKGIGNDKAVLDKTKRGNELRGLFEANSEETDGRLFLLFIQTAEAVLKYSEAAINKAGLSLVKLMVLQILQAHGGTLTAAEIARLTLPERHNVSILIRHMQKDQLIEVKHKTKDKKSVSITITEKGKQTITKLAPVARSIVKLVMSSLPDFSAAALGESLKILEQNAFKGLKRIQSTSRKHSNELPG